ncbi:MAG: PorP/SprF family type IX secretion system membrane protein [Bacteroidetes bacterium]|nr:PorP/SprF family type IX secretion system membrane protein [Bacteroidota bacterium]
MKKFLIYIFCFFAVLLSGKEKSFSQLMHFTQFYAAPTFLNPAFAGLGTCSRVNTNYRVQWPEIPGAFVTTLVSFDHQLFKNRTGLGFLFTNDKAGSGNLHSSSFAGQYSHQFLLGHGWSANAGAEAGYVIRDYNFSKFVFGDMIAYGTSVSVEQPNALRVHYLDLSSGVLFYNRRNWIGLSAHHMNMPNQAVISSDSRLPVLYSVHMGTKIPVGKKIDPNDNNPQESITPAFNYRHENKFDQADIGCYYARLPLVLGMWYRGIPLFKSYQRGYQNNDMISLIAGVAIDRFKFGYSYDVTISRLWKNTGGSHEISLSYQFCKQQPKKAFACPKF